MLKSPAPLEHPIQSDAKQDQGRSRHWEALVLLTLVSALLTLDRTIPQIVAEPIKREFSLSDSQLGLMLGLAFALPYAVAGVLLGPLIDRVSRKRFIAVLVTIWSALTFATGLVTNYVMLLVVRGSLGAAEATGTSASLSILGDYFPAHRRSTAVGILKIGVPLGVFLAGSIAGLVVGEYGWRAAFFFAGVPGFIVAFLLAVLIKEPVRGAMDGATEKVQTFPYSQVLRFALVNRVVTPFAIALLLAVFSGASLSGFAASLLQRYHGVEVQQVGAFFAIGSALSMLSPVAMGMIGDRVVQRGNSRLAFFLGFYATMTTLVAVGMILAPAAMPSILLFIAWQVLSLGLTAPSFGLLISLTPPGMRGTVMSMVTVGTMGIGFGLGPMFVGLVSDQIGGPEALRLALAFVVGISGLIGAMLFCLSGRNIAVQETR